MAVPSTGPERSFGPDGRSGSPHSYPNVHPGSRRLPVGNRLGEEPVMSRRTFGDRGHSGSAPPRRRANVARGNRGAGRAAFDPATEVADRRPQPGRRLAGIDLARALAMLGMLIEHVVQYPTLQPKGALWVVYGRSAPLFVLLAGVGLSLATRGAAVRPVDDRGPSCHCSSSPVWRCRCGATASSCSRSRCSSSSVSPWSGCPGGDWAWPRARASSADRCSSRSCGATSWCTSSGRRRTSASTGSSRRSCSGGDCCCRTTRP